MGIVTVNGKIVHFVIALLYVDEDIRDDLIRDKIDIHNEQAFIDVYSKRHNDKYNKIFDVENMVNKQMEPLIFTMNSPLPASLSANLLKYIANSLAKRLDDTLNILNCKDII